MSKPAEGEIWKLLVHPAATNGLVRFFESRRLYLFRMPADEDEEFPTYGIGIGEELKSQFDIAPAPSGVGEVATPPAAKCICPKFVDTGGFGIADLCCPVHGVDGTDPGDGFSYGETADAPAPTDGPAS